ncbi:MAG: SDR family oxidoreductase [Gammaproteobacteria bacterium]|jgi:NAD(P)-dependent dehydrogenase (short-subunit alcohol dehydrogenase family)|nr:SDR family oxidoreductase [Gammaproteobacteria bacterium]MBT7370230.1 SDR family oxidoreductase [Gammaproteobacteria bacterium]
MEIKGHNAIFVGGASGMARATAEIFSERGGNLAILDLPTSEGAAVAKELGGTYHECNVMDYDGTEQALNAAVEALGGSVHLCCNTAGGGLAKRTLSKDGPHPLDEFQRCIDLNLISAFNISRLMADKMSANEPNDFGERGCIINTASIAAFEGQIGQVGYAAAKSGIAGMTFVMARDLGSLGIRANAIAPSLFQTGLTAGIPDDFALALTKDAAFPKRMGLPVHYAIQAIAIYENAMMNGGTIRVDAGQRFAPK